MPLVWAELYCTANPMGTLDGGILCAIADAAMGMAFASTFATEESFTTVELKINFFRPVWQAQLRAQGTVIPRGRTVGYVECAITDGENRWSRRPRPLAWFFAARMLQDFNPARTLAPPVCSRHSRLFYVRFVSKSFAQRG
jgi:uncharacterized protein (TIGR00369 family)